MSGNYAFTKAGNPDAAVDNEGTIHAADGGNVVLAGPVVSEWRADPGRSRHGDACRHASLHGRFPGRQSDPLHRWRRRNGQAPRRTSFPFPNSGTISANGGHVLMTVRAAESVADERHQQHRHGGSNIPCTTKTAPSFSMPETARPMFRARSTRRARMRARPAARSPSPAIPCTSPTAPRSIASGSAGGGTIAIGGDLHGAGPTPNAQTTTVGKATLSADATDNGNGGTIAVWSDQSTQFAGSASARGAGKGNGGSVETSGGSLNVADGAHVDTQRAHRAHGRLADRSPGHLQHQEQRRDTFRPRRSKANSARHR